jgi:hypothetical protein
MTSCTRLRRYRKPSDESNPLAGTPLAIGVDDVIIARIGCPRLFAGHSPDGQRWLVAQVGEARRWLCAPASDRAIDCVLSGVAAPVDLLRHSATGTVEDVTIDADGRFFESVRLCSELSHDEVLVVTV